MFEPQVDPTTGILKNNFGIQDVQLLRQVERDLSALRLVELAQQPVDGDFDLEHLQDIHRYLFQDVYPWAGQFRQGGLGSQSKAEQVHALYERQAREAQQAGLFAALEENGFLQLFSPGQFSLLAGQFWGALSALQPFEAGNGFVQQEFMRELTQGAGFELGLTGISEARLAEAGRLALSGDCSGFQAIVAENLLPLRGVEYERRMAVIEGFEGRPGRDFSISREYLRQAKAWYDKGELDGRADEAIAKNLLVSGFDKYRVVQVMVNKSPVLGAKSVSLAKAMARKIVKKVIALPEVKRALRSREIDFE